jgi:hypothetical protein
MAAFIDAVDYAFGRFAQQEGNERNFDQIVLGQKPLT